ncbi:MAG: hypothetical protein ACLQNE_38525, partial [Thermoguttaceae bacterium]
MHILLCQALPNRTLAGDAPHGKCVAPVDPDSWQVYPDGERRERCCHGSLDRRENNSRLSLRESSAAFAERKATIIFA